MANQLFTNSLQFGSNKYMITKRLYQELLAETNYIADYKDCCSYVMKAITNCFREVQEVSQFETKKIDIEL